MGYFYEFELILAGIILLSAMAGGGIRIWLKRRAELKADNIQNQTQENISEEF